MGSSPVYQLSATTTSESSSLDHREFYIGKLMPNEEKSIEKEMLLPYGFDDEYAQLHVVFEILKTPIYKSNISLFRPKVIKNLNFPITLNS